MAIDPGARRLVTLADGRAVDVVEAGDPDGPPVLVLHGTPTGPLEAGMHADTARELGLRLVCPGRPGYADSTASERTGLSVVAEDTRELLDLLDIDSYAVLGISGGGPFAAAIAAATSPAPRGLAVLAGMAPRACWAPPVDEADAEECRLLDVAAAGERADAAAGIAGLIATVDFGRAPAPVQECFADASSHGWAGYAFDVLSWGLDWDVDVRAASCPAWLVYGDADAGCPPAYGEWYRTRLPHAELHVVPGADHAGAVTAGVPEVLARLGELLG